MGVLIRRADAVEAQPVKVDGAEGVAIRWLIDESDPGAERFVMRQFDVAPGGHTPRHRHEWEHEVFVLSGEGAVWTSEGERAIGPGAVVLVPPTEQHQFVNAGETPLRFLCLIPARHQCE